MKVTAFVGSARKKSTYTATEHFMHNLQSLGDIEYEIITLSDYHIELCKGCQLCFEKGEEFCPLKDDRDKLIEKMDNSDGFILASPNYSFNVSGHMKIFLDRLGFIFHRPHFFGKVYSNIVIQGIYGGNKITDYFNFIGKGLGFNVVKGCCLTALDPMTEKDQKNFDKVLGKKSRKFYSALIKKQYPIPTLVELMIFRMARTSIRLLLDESKRDFTYFKKNGWFESDYYYATKLDPFKRTAGILFDFLSNLIFRKNMKGGQGQHIQIADQ